MQVSVKLYATLRALAPPNTALGEAFAVETSTGVLSKLIDQLKIPHDQARIIFVNGVRITDLRYRLQPGDLVVIFPPVGGGQAEPAVTRRRT
jgi:molybdopterin converting factor small subunit